MLRAVAVLCLALIALAPLAASASPHPDDETPDAAAAGAVTQSLQYLYGANKQYLLAAAEKMPAADYTYRPTPEVRTYGEMLVHFADTQSFLCAAAAGRDAVPPQGEDAAVAADKAAVVARLEASFADCDPLYEAMTDGALSAADTASRGLTPTRALMLNVYHGGEHYGNVVTYLRLRGLVPPSTEARQPRPPESEAEAEPAAGAAGTAAPPEGAPTSDEEAARAKIEAAEAGMATYQFVLLKRGPKWTPEPTPEVLALQERHLAHLGEMYQAGKLVLSGPFLTDRSILDGWAGLLVFTASAEEVDAMVAEDPAVQAGRLVVERMPWMGPAGLGAKLGGD